MEILVERVDDATLDKVPFWLILIVFVLVTFLVALLFWLYLNIQASLQVDAQNAQIRLPQSLAVKIDINNGLDAHAIGEVDTSIDMNQKINVPLEGDYPAQLAFKVTTPVRVDIDYQTDIQIETLMPLEATTDLIYQTRLLPKFPLKLDIPIHLTVPFHLKRSYQLPIEIDFDAPVTLGMNENLNLDVQHHFKPKLRLNDEIEMNNISQFNAVMENIETETQANLNMQIDLPLSSIRH